MGTRKSSGKKRCQKILTLVIFMVFGIVIYLSISSIHNARPLDNPNFRLRGYSNALTPRLDAFKITDSDATVAPIVLSPEVVDAISEPDDKDTLLQLDVDTALPDSAFDTVLLVVASPNRPDYLRETLSLVLKYHPRNAIPILVSVDGKSSQVQIVIDEMKAVFQRQSRKGLPFVNVHNPTGGQHAENGYFALSRHFKWALQKAFSSDWMSASRSINAKRVIILEEDLRIAPDFFSYFDATIPLLESDSTLMTVSAWNDNGLGKFVSDEKQIYRSDFFPGLGWVMTRSLWEEWGPKWPEAYWDDWIREPPQRKGRQVLRPEVCRTFHFGKRGVSNQQFHTFTDDIKLNDRPVDFSSLDLSYLQQDSWDREYMRKIKRAQLIDPVKFRPGDYAPYSELRIEYNSLESGLSSFVVIARRFGIMENIKANVPRTAYKGIVSFWYNEVLKIHIVPAKLLDGQAPF